ncbi:MAG: NAD(P)H-hydrate dehydratase [Chloroflexi bacterium]|nr:NAD(P)H-hydrate dehydratase [Chloroflexota bacterium]
MKIVTAEQMQVIERQAEFLGVGTDLLMENAGHAVAKAILKRVTDPRRIKSLVLVGPGNNGGDGLVAARYLCEAGMPVVVYLWNRNTAADPNFQAVLAQGIPCICAAEDPEQKILRDEVRESSLIIDALLGTGKSRPISGSLAALLRTVRAEKRAGCQAIAVDIPSGLNSDTGAVDENTLRADLTVTLGYPKIGLFLLPGAAFVGELVVGDIGLPAGVVVESSLEMLTAEWIKELLPERPRWGHKGTFGRVLVVAGSVHYTGAAYLACSGAMRVGAGLVTLALARSLHPVLASKLTESTFLPLPEVEPGVLGVEAKEQLLSAMLRCQVLLVGPGLGQHPSTVALLEQVLRALSSAGEAVSPDPMAINMVIDADGLNGLASVPVWWEILPRRAVLTPHAGELGRLMGISAEAVQESRLTVALEAARRCQRTVVLKGAYTIIASPDGQAAINPLASPGLASAGTGDVLAGAIAGLMAQGLEPQAAAIAGVYLHGQAGAMVADDLGDAGMLAGDLLLALPKAIKELKQQSPAERSH